MRVALPVLVCALTDPEESDTPSAFPAGVRTALCLRGNASPAELTRKLTFCAARTPLLALDGVLLTVRCATDLGQLPLWRGILREFSKRRKISGYDIRYSPDAASVCQDKPVSRHHRTTPGTATTF